MTTPRTILLIGDKYFSAPSVEKLEELGFTVLAAANVLEAIDQIDQEPIAMIITDHLLNYPEAVADIIKHTRASLYNSATPIAVATSGENMEHYHLPSQIEGIEGVEFYDFDICEGIYIARYVQQFFSQQHTASASPAGAGTAPSTLNMRFTEIC